MFGNHGLCGLLEEGAHGKSPKCLGGNLGDFGEFCKGLHLFLRLQRMRFLLHSEGFFLTLFCQKSVNLVSSLAKTMAALPSGMRF